MLDIDVLDAGLVGDEGELEWSPIVLPNSGYELVLEVAVCVVMFLQELVDK